MTRRRIIHATSLAATAITILGALPAEATLEPAPGAEHHGPAASITGQATAAAEPTSRGRRDRERDGFERDQAAPPEESAPAEQPMPCPEDMWSLPVQIKGVACVLLLPKPDDPSSETP